MSNFPSPSELITTYRCGDSKVTWPDGRVISFFNGVLRFLDSEKYTSSFGFQWKRFRRTQLDSSSVKKISRRRVEDCTRWTEGDLIGKAVLEAGCGAGRFSEVLLSMGAKLFAADMSQAVEVAKENNSTKEDALFLQADICQLPFPKEYFDFVFCYGVLQHTPDPRNTFLAISSHLRPGGRISVDVYAKDGLIRPWKSKYLWRWATTRIPVRILYYLTWIYVPLWLPLHLVLERIPIVGVYLASLVPCFNLFDWRYPTWEGLERTVLDTFDALSATYDIPQTKVALSSWGNMAGLVNVEIFEGGNGYVLNAKRPIEKIPK